MFRDPIIIFVSIAFNIRYCIVKYYFSSVEVGIIGGIMLKHRIH